MYSQQPKAKPGVGSICGLLVVLALAVGPPGCSSSRSNLPVQDGGGDTSLTFNDARSDLFVPPVGASLRGELVSGGGLSEASGTTLQGVVGELTSFEVMTGGGNTCQWDSVVLPTPQ